MRLDEYGNMACYCEKKWPEKYRKLKGFFKLCLFALSIFSSVLTSLMMIWAANTSINTLIGALALLTSIIFTCFFYKSCVLDNFLITATINKAKKLWPDCLNPKDYCYLQIKITDNIDNTSYLLVAAGEQKNLGMIEHQLFQGIKNNQIYKDSYKLQIASQCKRIEKSNGEKRSAIDKNTPKYIKTKKELYKRFLHMSANGCEIRKVGTQLVPSQNPKDVVFLISEQQGAIGLFITCMLDKLMPVPKNKAIKEPFSGGEKTYKSIRPQIKSMQNVDYGKSMV